MLANHHLPPQKADKPQPWNLSLKIGALFGASNNTMDVDVRNVLPRQKIRFAQRKSLRPSLATRMKYNSLTWIERIALLFSTGDDFSAASGGVIKTFQ